jgi:hypothetical protein
MTVRFFTRKLLQRRVWKKIFVERLTEPVHLNIAAGFVAIFGSFRSKVAWDMIVRPHYAYGVLHAADQAKQHGLRAVTVIETGVANGEGLFNLCDIAERVEEATGISIEVVGFDSGKGMPPALDYRDHPELYIEGDFPMQDLSDLPARASLRIGDLRDTIPTFLAECHAPIGLLIVDVDYYSSARDALTLCDAAPENYTPIPLIYFDDIMFETHNDWCGELLAIAEFNEQRSLRKIQQDRFLATRRVLKNARWLQQIYVLHVLDHSHRSVGQQRDVSSLGNDYLVEQSTAIRSTVVSGEYLKKTAL